MENTPIAHLRHVIDSLDDEIIAAIAKRHKISKQIGEYKKLHSIDVLDKNREQYLHDYHIELSKKYNISAQFVEAIFELIVSQSRTIQN